MTWTDAAAWVQAVGSIAAIWAAGKFPVAERRAAEVDRLSMIDGVLTLAASVVDEAVAQAQPGSIAIGGFNLDGLDRIVERVEAISPIEAGNRTVVIILQTAIEALQRARDFVRRGRSSAGNMTPPSAEIVNGLRKEQTNLNQAISQLNHERRLAVRRRRLWWLV